MPFSMITNWLSSFSDFLRGFIFAVQLFSTIAVAVYVSNEWRPVTRQFSSLQLLKGALRMFRLIHKVDEKKLKIQPDKTVTSTTVKEGIQRMVMNRMTFETTEWLNVVINCIFCGNSGRSGEALLEDLGILLQKALESKLSDYEQDAWLFLKSLRLESCKLGRSLPLITAVKIYSKNLTNLAFIVDFEYEGGIELILQAAMTLNIRNFSALLRASPSKFKLIIKLESTPSPRLSLMFSDIPKHVVDIDMRGRKLTRVSELIDLMVQGMLQAKFIYPNYLTLLFLPEGSSEEGKFVTLATTKQFLSQLRIRVVSAHVNSQNANLQSGGFDGQTALNVYCLLRVGEFVSKTDVSRDVNGNPRWNSIHSFTVFPELQNGPVKIYIEFYQQLNPASSTTTINSSSSLILNDSFSGEYLGHVEVLYDEIAAGLLDVRTLDWTDDPLSTVTVEMYKNFIEEKGTNDAHWIFWNCPIPSKRNDEEAGRKIDQLNWSTIKFIIGKLSGSETFSDGQDESSSLDGSSRKSRTTSQTDQLLLNEELLSEIQPGLRSNGNQVFSLPSLLDQIHEQIEQVIVLLNEKVIEPLQRLENACGDRNTSINSLPLSNVQPCVTMAVQLRSVVSVLSAEIGEFCSRCDLSRSPLSEQVALEHNKRQATLLVPVVKSFIPSALEKTGALGRACADLEALEELEFVGRVEGILQSLQKSVEMFSTSINEQPRPSISQGPTFDLLRSRSASLPSANLRRTSSEAALSSIRSRDATKERDRTQTSLLSIDSTNSHGGPMTFFCHLGDYPMVLTLDRTTGLSMDIYPSLMNNSNPQFEPEGLFYTPRDAKKYPLSQLDLSSPFLLSYAKNAKNSALGAPWEVELIEKNLVMIPFGRDHFFPSKIIPIVTIVQVALLKERGAFNLGTAPSSSSSTEIKASAAHGILRITLNSFERVDLIGDARNCDSWYCLLSSLLTCRDEDREGSEKYSPLSPDRPIKTVSLSFSFDQIGKVWLIPIPSPNTSTKYSIAVSVRKSPKLTGFLNEELYDTFVIGSFFGAMDIHLAYCELRAAVLLDKSSEESIGGLKSKDLVIMKNSASSHTMLTIPSEKYSTISPSIKSQPLPASSSSSLSRANVDPFDQHSGKYQIISLSKAEVFDEQERLVQMKSIESFFSENQLAVDLAPDGSSPIIRIEDFPEDRIDEDSHVDEESVALSDVMKKHVESISLMNTPINPVAEYPVWTRTMGTVVSDFQASFVNERALYRGRFMLTPTYLLFHGRRNGINRAYAVIPIDIIINVTTFTRWFIRTGGLLLTFKPGRNGCNSLTVFGFDDEESVAAALLILTETMQLYASSQTSSLGLHE